MGTQCNDIQFCQLKIDISTSTVHFWPTQNALITIYLADFGDKLARVEQIDADLVRIAFSFGDTECANLAIQRECDEGLECYTFRWSKCAELQFLKDTIWLGDQNSGMRWFGGVYANQQKWPIARTGADYAMQPFVLQDVTKCQTSGQERHWLCSSLVCLTVPEHVPLWTELSNGHLKLQSAVHGSPFLGRNNFLEYTLTVPDQRENMSLRHFHMLCARKYLQFPKECPDLAMVRAPIWSTWARHWSQIDHAKVVAFARQIHTHRFPVCQLELDDGWAAEYGDHEPDRRKFPDFGQLVAELKHLNVPRVTVWVHPFVNLASKNGQNGALAQRCWLRTSNGLIGTVHWWNGNAYVVDMTNPMATDWYATELRKLTELGVHSFKFDAGECNWLPPDFWPLNARTPNDFGRAYAQFLADNFAPSAEMRFASGTQQLGVFLRMMDRNSYWDERDGPGGMDTVIPWVLNASLHGYHWLIPDMIGGCGREQTSTDPKGRPPSKELFIRWTQLCTFLVAMQFSHCPWDFDAETVAICRAMLELRAKWMPYLVECIQCTLRSGEPVIRPLWWNCELPEALECCDQFLVGEQLLVAPVLREGEQQRRVFLPPGKWRNELDGHTHEGPTTIDVQAPLCSVPHFVFLS